MGVSPESGSRSIVTDNADTDINPVTDEFAGILSHAEQSIWYREQMDPGDIRLHNHFAVHITGELKTDSLARALHVLCGHTPRLRMAFIEKAGSPVRKRGVDAAPVLEKVALVKQNNREKLDQLIADHVRREFDLSRGPLIRPTLIELGTHDHILLLTSHAICCSARSLVSLTNELFACYAAEEAGERYTYPYHPGDESRSEVVSDDTRPAIPEELTAAELIRLPRDRIRPVPGSGQGSLICRRLDELMSDRIRSRMQKIHVPDSAVFAAALAAWCHHLDPSESLSFGMVSESPFDPAGEPAWMAGDQEQIVCADFHDHTTVNDLIERFIRQPAGIENRTAGGMPNVTIRCGTGDLVRRYDSVELTIEVLHHDYYPLSHDLVLDVRDDGCRYTVSMVYSHELFDNETARRFMRQYLYVLEQAVASPSSAVDELTLIDESQRRLIKDAWSGETTDYPRKSGVHSLFERCTAAKPEAIAVVDGERYDTYGALNERANRLAHYLMTSGVSRGSLVCVHLDRSIEMIVAILGILKAGAAYVPLDPGYPEHRLAYMLADSGCSVLITDGSLPAIPAGPGVQVIDLARSDEPLDSMPTDNPETPTGGDDLAYVMYTSGSTGQPKGVMIPHRGIVRLVCDTDYLSLTASDRVAHVSNCSFDASTFEIWSALLSGATLVVLDRETVLSPPRLAERLKSDGVTVLFLTTALFNVLAKQSPGAIANVSHVLFGGEQVDPQWVRRVLDENGPVRLLHVYGPTENTTFTSWYEVKSVPADAWTVPIGRAIANTRIYVLDRNKRPVAPGEPGELYIGGDGLALGYLGHDELTREKFVTNPFDRNGESCLYRTGDLVRRRDDGTLVFLGRLDSQVKLRGFRIELGEIESVLSEHPSVSETFVMLREDEPGDKRLVGYVVLHDGGEPDEAMLCDHLRTMLPGYMIPSKFLFLGSLPLTPNGKVDRKSLPAPSSGREHDDDGMYVPPRTREEKVLADLWQEVLGIDRASATDNFHALGGHSLHAVQIIARLHDRYNAELTIDRIFDSRSLRELAECIELPTTPAGRARPSVIEHVERRENLPVSSAQERVCFIHQLDPGTIAYNFQATIRLHGNLNIHALERSLNEIIRRHEIYRTTFKTLTDGRTVQVIHDPQPITLDVIDLRSDGGEGGTRRRADAIIEREIRRPFDIERLYLIRWMLLQHGDDDYELLHIEHHLVHDGWSINVFLGELLSLYESYQAGRDSCLPEPAIQFADFSHWQRTWSESEQADQQLSYWRRQLSGASPLLELPYDRPRQSVQTFNGAAMRFDLPSKLSRMICDYSRRSDNTQFMILLAGLAALFYRYSGQTDINIGTGMANRRLSEMESLIGMIINNVVLRCDVSNNPTIRELMKQIRRISVEAYANQDVPFDRVVEAVQPERNISYNPLFQVMFGLHDAPMPQGTHSGLTGELTLGLNNGSSKFDMTIIVVPHTSQRFGKHAGDSDGFSIVWEYNTDLFDRSTVERMAGHYQSILADMISNDDRHVSELSLLSPEERTRQLVDWNGRAYSYPRNRCIHTLFEDHAKQSPESIALVWGNERITYKALNERANQLAHWLIGRGIVRGDLVGLYMHRSIDVIVSILAILKAGGAYVPLDPSYPSQRLSFMLEDTRTPIILSHRSLCDGIPASASQPVCLDGDDMDLSSMPVSNPGIDTEPTDLAYIMYTSGSTGRPKGVMVRHRGVVRLVTNVDYVELGTDEVLLQLAPISFDASTFEIWGSLLNGGRCVLFPSAVPSARELGEVITRERVSTMWLTSSLFNLLIGESPEVLRGLKQLLTGGEALSVPHIRQGLADLPGVRLINGYGPTENTTFTCCYRIPANLPVPLNSIPIGRLIPNTTAYVMDTHMNLVPEGVWGELYIGGDGLAAGYLNRPELTAERFVRNPFSNDQDACLYRTGDIVRLLGDGNLEFGGRRDDQVKIRGFRIELGEIESVLASHENVREAVVNVHEREPGDKRLIGYIVPFNGETADLEQIRTYLQCKLPDYMVPPVLVPMDELPLSPNGKVDRRKLPKPELRSLPEDKLVPPRNELEERIASIWRAVLGMKTVGIYERFFEIGGHSLLATRVVSRLRQELGVELPLSSMFEHATIAEQAKLIEMVYWAGRTSVTALDDAVSSSDRESGEL